MDLKLAYIPPTLPGEWGYFDLVLDASGQLAMDDGLESAIILALYTNARNPDDRTRDRMGAMAQGYWGNALSPEVPEMGSLFYSFAREPRTEATRERYRREAEQRLSVLVDDGVAQSITVEAEFWQEEGIALKIRTVGPTGDARQYDFIWRR
jgi:phage gp46-like protein